MAAGRLELLRTVVTAISLARLMSNYSVTPRIRGLSRVAGDVTRCGGKARQSLRRVVVWLPFALVAGIVFASAARMPDEGLDRADKLASVGSLVIGVAALLFAGMALRVGSARGTKSASGGGRRGDPA